MEWKSIAATVAGVGAVLAALVKTVPKVREFWLRIRHFLRSVDEKVSAKLELEASLRAMRRVALLEHLLRQWMPLKHYQRALVLTANNGGKAWRGGGPLFVSNPAQVAGSGEPNTRDLWSEWKVDGWYADFLGRLLATFNSRASALPIVASTDVEGELRKQYDRQGTVCSVVIPFKWIEGSVLWYVSFNFGRFPGSPDDSGRPPRPLSDEDVTRSLHLMRQIAEDPARCRVLAQELARTYDSVR